MRQGAEVEPEQSEIEQADEKSQQGDTTKSKFDCWTGVLVGVETLP